MNRRLAPALAALLLLLGAPGSAAAQHAGDAVRVNGVGISNERADLFVVEYLARKGRNPRTGDSVEVPEKRVPYFKPGKDMRLRLNAE